jgi:hypothetical protein
MAGDSGFSHGTGSLGIFVRSDYYRDWSMMHARTLAGPGGSHNFPKG